MKSPKRKLLTVPFDLLVLEQETRVFRRRFEGKSLLSLSLSISFFFLRNLNSSKIPLSGLACSFSKQRASNYEIIDEKRREKSRKQQGRGRGESVGKNRMKYGGKGGREVANSLLGETFYVDSRPGGKYCRHQMRRSDILSSFCDSIWIS